MPGGKGLIKPEDGHQIEPGEKLAEKWTEEISLELGNELIEWMQLDGNIFWQEFFVMVKGFYVGLPSHLGTRFTSFSKLIEKAKKIQELKILKGAIKGDLSSSFSKFTLINNHGYKSNGTDIDINLNQNNVHIYIPDNGRDNLDQFEDLNIITDEEMAKIDKELESGRIEE